MPTLHPTFRVVAGVCCLLLTALPGAMLPGAAVAGGWVNKLPPNQLVPDSGRRNHVFYVGETQGAFEQRIVVQVDLSHGQIIGRPPIGMHFMQSVV